MSMLLEAKKLFEKYQCSHFLMARESDEDYNKYESYKITKEQENLWINDKIEECKNKLVYSNNNSEIARLIELICRYARASVNEKCLLYVAEYMITNHNRLDTNTKVRIANALMNLYNLLVRKDKLSLEVCHDFLCAILHLLKQEKIITISDDYMENGVLPNYLTKDELHNDLLNVIKGYTATLNSLLTK